MRATILAAGLGQRLQLVDPPPKTLLEFDGESLLARHIRLLKGAGIDRVDIVTGYRAEEIEREIARLGAGDWVATNYNPDFKRGPIVSLWTLRDVYRSGEPVIFMDGDVLYDHRMLERLLNADSSNCFLLDRETGEGDDPVRLCMRDGALVDFHKKPKLDHDWWGEWIGFARFSPEIAAKIADATERYIDAGRLDEIYEEAFRDILISEPRGTFGVEDISGLPWVEIDFPEDLERAREVILQRLKDSVRVES